MRFILLLIVFISLSSRVDASDDGNNSFFNALVAEPVRPKALSKETEKSGILDFFKDDYDNKQLRTFWVFCFYLIIAALVKLGYHQSHFLRNNIPESCVLIMTGIGFGTFFKISKLKDFPHFTTDLFFFGLMPPIILEAAHTLNDRNFFNNFITITMYAVVGTLINVILIGTSLYLMSIFFINFPQLPLIEVMLFSNAISAVDPVTVLAIFQDLRVNKPLYYLVFGESLLNDAVVIVLHELMTEFLSSAIITVIDIIKGIGFFMYMSVVGFLIGIAFGILSAVMTLHTAETAVIEPLIVIGLAYFAFLTADLFKTSGLIALIGCGLIQVEFTHKNVTKKSQTTIKYLLKTLSSVADLLIFFFLGQMLMNETPEWNSFYIFSTLVFILVYRCVSVTTLTYISNTYFYRNRIINFEEQVLMTYGGLRGAVAFAMVALLTDEDNYISDPVLFRTTTFIVIFFTVFVLGATTKPLLKILRIQRESSEGKKLCNVLNDKIIDTIIDGIDVFIGNTSLLNLITHKLQNLMAFLRKYISKDFDSKDIMEIKKIQSIQGMDKIKDINKSDENNVMEKTGIDTKTLSHEDFQKVLDTMTHKLDTNKDDYMNIVSQKLIKNVFVMETVVRSHTIPQELSGIVINAKNTFQSEKSKIFSLRSDQIDDDKLLTRFNTSTNMGDQGNTSKIV